MSGDKIIICPGAIYNKRVEQQNIFGVVNVYSSNKGAKDSQTVSSLQQIDCYVDEDNKNDESSKDEEVQNASPHEMNFPEVEQDKTLFHTSLRVNAIKGTLYRLIAKEKQDDHSALPIGLSCGRCLHVINSPQPLRLLS